MGGSPPRNPTYDETVTVWESNMRAGVPYGRPAPPAPEPPRSAGGTFYGGDYRVSDTVQPLSQYSHRGAAPVDAAEAALSAMRHTSSPPPVQVGRRRALPQQPPPQQQQQLPPPQPSPSPSPGSPSPSPHPMHFDSRAGHAARLEAARAELERRHAEYSAATLTSSPPRAFGAPLFEHQQRPYRDGGEVPTYPTRLGLGNGSPSLYR